MKQWLVGWSLYPAYGNPSGYEFVEAERSIDAYKAVEAKARKVSAQGQFYATPIDVSHLSGFIAEAKSWSQNELRLRLEIIKAVRNDHHH